MIFVYIALLLLAVALVLILCGNSLKSTTRTVYYENLPSGFDGMKIVVLSDLHDRRFANEFDAVAKRVRLAGPDMIVLPGDIHNRGCKRLDYVTFLKEMTAIAPVYFVRGNHDPDETTPEEYEEFLHYLDETGVKWLTEEKIVRGEESITMLGTDWLRSMTVLPEGFVVRVAHNPMVFDEAMRADLTLCGHIHGGFMRLPRIGAVFSPGEGTCLSGRFKRQFFYPKYSRGVYERGDKKMYVNEGLGFTAFPPFRLIRGEVGTIVLKKFSKNS